MMSRKFNKLISVITCFILLLGLLQPVNVSAEENESQIENNTMEKADDYLPVNTPLEPVFKTLQEQLNRPSILLIEDKYPTYPEHYSTLQSLGLGDVTKVSALQVSGIDLVQYDIVILLNDQRRFIDYIPVDNEYVRTQLEQYAMGGGIVIVGLNGLYSLSEGYTTQYKVLGGVQAEYFYLARRYQTINDTKHPIVTSELTDNIALKNEDLVYDNNLSVLIESSLPPESIIILRDEYNQPTLVEYPLGKGTVIASAQSWEHALLNNYDYAQTYDDLITYAAYLADADFTIQASTAAGIAGDVVDITVSMEKNPGIAGFSFELDFDNQYITPINVVTGSAISNTYTNLEDEKDFNTLDKITAVWSNATNITVDARDLITIRFKIKEDTPTGTYSVGIKGMVINELFEELDFRTIDGTVSVLNGQDLLYGDVYSDGIVNIKDAVKFAQYLSGRIELNTYETFVADVHKNDMIDIRDAIKLSQYLAGYENITLGTSN